jgi:hypothetical protein
MLVQTGAQGYSGCAMKGARLAFAASLAAFAASFAASSGQPQSPASAAARGPEFAWPERMTNARVLPADTRPDRLRDTMRHFATSLGVRCTFCHVGPEGAPLSQLDFVSDANPHKEAARSMMRMTATLNNETLPAVPGLHRPRVSCFTCHRGATSPATEPTAPVPAPAPAPAAPQPAAPPQGQRGA